MREKNISGEDKKDIFHREGAKTRSKTKNRFGFKYKTEFKLRALEASW
jgi:hypothetical protein